MYDKHRVLLLKFSVEGHPWVDSVRASLSLKLIKQWRHLFSSLGLGLDPGLSIQCKLLTVWMLI